MESLLHNLHPETWEDEAVPLSCSAADMTGKIFDKILPARILSEATRREPLCNELFGFRTKHSTSLQLATLL